VGEQKLKTVMRKDSLEVGVEYIGSAGRQREGTRRRKEVDKKKNKT